MNYVLGPKVRELEITDDNDRVVKTPSWKLVLDYEFKRREYAYSLMNYGDETLKEPVPMDVASAMKKARDDKDLRRDYFIEKLTLQPTQKPTPPPKPTPKLTKAQRKKKAEAARGSTDDPEPKVKGKGKGRKGGKKGVLKLKGKQLHVKVGECEICFKYNEEGGCHNENCKRKHVCQVCLGAHPAWNNH